MFKKVYFVAQISGKPGWGTVQLCYDRLLLLMCVIVCLSCGRKDYEHVECAIKTVNDHVRILDTRMIQEVYNPCDLYSVGDDILVINRDKSGKVIYRYHSNMSFKEAYFSYGRASNEFSFIDSKLKRGSDSTLYLYTNWYYCTEFSIDERGITVTDNFPVLKDVQNNVILLNDSLVFYNALLKNCPFQVYNYVSDEVLCSFGDFPEAPIIPETDADRDNICQSSSVYDVNGRKLISFYESIPVIRIYDMVTYELIREIRIVDSEKQIASLDDYYDEKSIIYFLQPVLAGKYVYTIYLNTRSDDKFIEKTVLIKMDLDGNIVARFTLDRYCTIYTVSDDGMFYGISISGGEYFLCKTRL